MVCPLCLAALACRASQSTARALSASTWKLCSMGRLRSPTGGAVAAVEGAAEGSTPKASWLCPLVLHSAMWLLLWLLGRQGHKQHAGNDHCCAGHRPVMAMASATSHILQTLSQVWFMHVLWAVCPRLLLCTGLAERDHGQGTSRTNYH